MKKLLILIVFLLCAAALFSQETVKYTPIDDRNVKVEIYVDGKISQTGEMTLVGKIWRPNNVWMQYDKEGNIILYAKYIKGIRQYTKKEFEGYSVIVDRT